MVSSAKVVKASNPKKDKQSTDAPENAAMIDESGFINGFNDNNVPSPVPLRSELIHRIQNH